MPSSTSSCWELERVRGREFHGTSQRSVRLLPARLSESFRPEQGASSSGWARLRPQTQHAVLMRPDGPQADPRMLIAQFWVGYGPLAARILVRATSPTGVVREADLGGVTMSLGVPDTVEVAFPWSLARTRTSSRSCGRLPDLSRRVGACDSSRTGCRHHWSRPLLSDRNLDPSARELVRGWSGLREAPCAPKEDARRGREDSGRAVRRWAVSTPSKATTGSSGG